MIAQIEPRQLGFKRGVGGDGHDMLVLRVQQRLPVLPAPDFELGKRIALVALDEQQVAGRDSLDLLLERGFRLAAQLVHDHPALFGHHYHLAAARFAMAIGIPSRMIDLEAVVRVLDERHLQAALDEARDELLDQSRLAAFRPSRESEYFHAEPGRRWCWRKASLYQGVIPTRI